MRHRDAGRKFGRNSTHRNAMFRNMVTSLLDHGRIEAGSPGEAGGLVGLILEMQQHGVFDLHHCRWR